jgi:hypothetical protein
MNTGDWVESCTALVEDFDGNFEIITWTGIAAPAEAEAKLRLADAAGVKAA